MKITPPRNSRFKLLFAIATLISALVAGSVVYVIQIREFPTNTGN